ncbi:MAG: LLM class F420-dependent oxidoreductase [Deltaproteobacteria bacterium]|nr:LLM class F420-dependent oxidoreductase [Deltaproteobacteria bacterium]
MQFMLQYPDFHGAGGDMLDAGSVAEIAVAAERAGFGGLAFTEHPAPGARWLAAGGHQALDPFVALGGAATVTTRIRLLTYLTVVPYRNPLLLAKSAATVDRLSNGRFILGAGAGYLKGEFAALGADFDERNASFDEALDILPLSWRGEPFSYQGKRFSARDVQVLPKPAQQPIPIWLGGNSKATLRRVAERCQGWMPLVGPAELFKTARTANAGSHGDIAATMHALRGAAAQRGATLDLALPYSVADVAKSLADGDRHREAFAHLAEIGATWLIVTLRSAPREAVLDFIAAFGETHLGR